jgi:hypothetical protein
LHRTFPIHDLSDDEFEELVVAICHHILGTGTIVFAVGRDGGRDGIFTGTAAKFPSPAAPLTGKFVVQAKHTQNPAASCADAEFGRILSSSKRASLSIILYSPTERSLLVMAPRRKRC